MMVVFLVFEDVGGFALTSHWSGGGYQVMHLSFSSETTVE
jgi:hypothetical protein